MFIYQMVMGSEVFNKCRDYNIYPIPIWLLVEDIRLSGSGDPDKISVLPLSEDEDLVYVYNEEI